MAVAANTPLGPQASTRDPAGICLSAPACQPACQGLLLISHTRPKSPVPSLLLQQQQQQQQQQLRAAWPSWVVVSEPGINSGWLSAVGSLHPSIFYLVIRAYTGASTVLDSAEG